MIRNKELLEIQNSVLSITVGMVFIADYFFHGNLYDRFPDTYRFMKFLPSIAWGIAYSLAGGIHLTTLLTAKAERLRKEILLVKSGLWFFLGWCVVYADVFAASGWLYFIFAFFALVSFIRFQHPRSVYAPPSQSEIILG